MLCMPLRLSTPARNPPAVLRDFLLDTSRERLANGIRWCKNQLQDQYVIRQSQNVVRDAALEDEADLILIGRGVIQGMLGRLRSEAYTIIREAPCPVISI